MKLFIFKSHASSELRAFAGDITGSKLPDKFSPWHVIGVVAAGRARLTICPAPRSRRPSS
jgi:hypothetical protein